MITVYRGRPGFSAAAQFQNVINFGFQVQGYLYMVPPVGTTGYLKEFYWNDKLTDQTQHMLRFGFKVLGTAGGITPPPPPPPPPVPTPVGGTISGGTFTKGQWREIVGQIEAARRAREELLARAHSLKQAKARKALQAAARVAQEAIQEAGRQFELNSLTSAMQSAAEARKLADVVFEASRVKDIARELIAWAEQDEEETEWLLLS